MELDLFVTPGLGDNSYVVSWGDEAAVIDPQRDVDRFVETARSRDARIRYVIETHVHNDYVSGAGELRVATGAEILAPATGGYAFPTTPVEDGTRISIGDGSLEALATPGHTPEHTSYLLRDFDGEGVALFSGGSLIVGSAGRTDLLGPERADELTRLQFRTMRRLSALPDQVLLLPTHGAGSFCASAPPSSERTSTLGDERHLNPALADLDEEAFVRQQLAGLVAYPDYYAHMAPINRAGPPVFGAVPIPAAMTVDDAAAALAGGAWLVDTRNGSHFAGAHVPGSLNVPLEPSFAAYVGWLLPFATPIVLLVESHEGLVEASTQLHRIGWDPVLGHLEGGVATWAASGRETASYPAIGVEQLVAEIGRGEAGDVVDVRQKTEWDAGHLEGSRHVFVGDVPDSADAFSRSVRSTIVCASGYRSSMVASMLAREGVPVRVVSTAGVPRALRLLRGGA
ncbi:MAG TPA: rhodanese-like domain-containing protein [Actinomycetota bacterium]|nr:rhodanese-like domain-containing protein [Actinomycetota bacterium]